MNRLPETRWRLLFAIGASWGGLSALRVLLGALSPAFVHPVVLVLHRPSGGTSSLVEVLSQWTHLCVREPDDGDAIEPEHLYVAPAGYHTLVDATQLRLSLDDADHFSRPSVDALLHSAGDTPGRRAAGILLTGASRDGAAGLAHLRRRGGWAVVQDPLEADRDEMPRAGIAAATVDSVMKVSDIGHWMDSCSAGVMFRQDSNTGGRTDVS